MENNEEPVLVTIRCLAYNHEPYIRECLEGFVMQKTNFKFEAIVHDDASTDKTAEIIREYAEKYPAIIKPIYETENLYSKHDGSLGRIMDDACAHGKYVAYCEGDDYWTDSLKLQKQVDFMEQHPDVSYTCCRFDVKNEFDKTCKICGNLYFDKDENKDKDFFLFDQSYPFLVQWVSLTLTQMIRRDAMDSEFCQKFKYSRDVHLIYSVLRTHKGACLNFVGGVSRISSASTFGQYPIVCRLKTSYEVYKEFYSCERTKLLRICMVNALTGLLNHGCWVKPQSLLELSIYLRAVYHYFFKKIHH